MFKCASVIGDGEEDIISCQNEIAQIKNLIHDVGYKLLINSDSEKILVKEDPNISIWVFLVEKKSRNDELYIWKKNSEDCIIPKSLISNDEEDEDRPFSELLTEAKQEALKKDVWNVYTTIEDKYCLKTKILASSTCALGLGALWYYYCPTCFNSFWNQFLIKA